MATLVHELDLPTLQLAEGRAAQRMSATSIFPRDAWLAHNMFGFAVWHYDDVTSILRDKRWHSATSRIPELMGVTDQRFLDRQQVNILSAEGDVHTRLRRLVAPAFSPRAADRLRPFMRKVVNGLVDTVSAAGAADIAVDIKGVPVKIVGTKTLRPEKGGSSVEWTFDITSGIPLLGGMIAAFAGDELKKNLEDEYKVLKASV